MSEDAKILVRCDRDDYNHLAHQLKIVPNPLSTSPYTLLQLVVTQMSAIIQAGDDDFENPQARTQKTNLNLAVTQLNGLSIVNSQSFEEFDDDSPHFPNANNNGEDGSNEALEKIELNKQFELSVKSTDYQTLLHYCLDSQSQLSDLLTLYLTHCASHANVVKSANPNQLLADKTFSYVIGLDKPTVLNDDNEIDDFDTLRWFDNHSFDFGEGETFNHRQLQDAFLQRISDIRMHLKAATVANVYANRKFKPQHLTGFDYLNIVNAHLIGHVNDSQQSVGHKTVIKFLLHVLAQFQKQEDYGNGYWLVFNLVNRDQFHPGDIEKLLTLKRRDYRGFNGEIDGDFNQRFQKLAGTVVLDSLLETFDYPLADQLVQYLQFHQIKFLD